MGDDGLGPRLLLQLAVEHEFPPDLELVEIGTPGLDLIPYLNDLELLVVIDSINVDAAPGSIRRYGREEILGGTLESRLGPHDPTLKEALLTADFAGEGPRDVILLGAVPGSCLTGTGLSPALSASLPELEKRVLAELAEHGYPARARRRPQAPDVWWEREGLSSKRP